MSRLLILVMVATAVGASPARQDQGGVAFDFAALSEAWHPTGERGPNVVPPGEWKLGKPHVWAYPQHLPANSPVRTRVGGSKAITLRRVGDEMRLESSPALLADAGTRLFASLVGVKCGRDFPFSGEPGEYELAFRYRHFCEYCHGARVTALKFRAMDAAGKTIGEASAQLGRDGVWTNGRKTVSVPGGTASISLEWNLDGVGYIGFLEPTLRRVQPARKDPPPPIVLRNSVPHNLDGKFCVSEGQCGAYTLEWKEGSENGASIDLAALRFHFEVPPCVTVAASAAMDKARTTVATNADGSTSMHVALAPGCPKPAKAFNRYGRPFIFLVKASAPAGASGVGSVVVERDGKAVSNREEVRFEVVPRITARKPKRFIEGIIAGTDVFTYDDEEAEDAMASFAAECGVGWVIRSCPPRVCEKLRSRGVKWVSTVSEEFRDGYVIGPPKGIPASDRFVPEAGKEGKPPFNISVCPVSVYTESEHFRTKSLPLLERQVRGYDGLWVNWELWQYARHGCFCDRCRAAFAKFCGVDEETVKAVWPDAVAMDGEWGSKYERFRSEEGAKVVRTLDKYVRKFCRDGERSPGFMPGISFIQVTSWRESHLAHGLAGRGFSEADIHDWLPYLEVAHAWAPYPHWNTSSRWNVPKESEGCGEVAYFVAAKDVRESMDRWYGRGRHHLTGVPQGLQGDVWVAQPESIEMALDCYLFNGWDSTTVYFFPRGYDARHWRAFASAATRAARYEDAVFHGKRTDSLVSLKPQAGYPPPVPKPSHYLVARDASMLQHAAYDYNGRRYVAVFNFSWNVPASVELDTDFAGGKYDIVDESGRRWPRGGRLTVPAARTRVFELHPHDVAEGGM